MEQGGFIASCSQGEGVPCEAVGRLSEGVRKDLLVNWACVRIFGKEVGNWELCFGLDAAKKRGFFMIGHFLPRRTLE